MKDTQQPSQPGPQTTRGVQTLLGNPKKAILKLSIPMIVAMSVHTLYNFVDGLWWGIVFGNSLGAMIAFTWGRIYVRRLKATFSSSEVVAAV